MENSFYYFFSTTSQVLAAILALFGVFVIFKIQNLKDQLFAIANRFDQGFANHVSLKSVLKDGVSMRNFIDNFSNEDLKGLNHAFEIIHAIFINTRKEIENSTTSDSQLISQNQYRLTTINTYEKFPINFKNLYNSRQKLIDNTIKLSISSAVVIIFSISIIPFAKFLCRHPFIVYLIFTSIIVCLVIIFYYLISILKESLQDKEIKEVS